MPRGWPRVVQAGALRGRAVDDRGVLGGQQACPLSLHWRGCLRRDRVAPARSWRRSSGAVPEARGRLPRADVWRGPPRSATTPALLDPDDHAVPQVLQVPLCGACRLGERERVRHACGVREAPGHAAAQACRLYDHAADAADWRRGRRLRPRGRRGDPNETVFRVVHAHNRCQRHVPRHGHATEAAAQRVQGMLAQVSPAGEKVQRDQLLLQRVQRGRQEDVPLHGHSGGGGQQENVFRHLAPRLAVQGASDRHDVDSAPPRNWFANAPAPGSPTADSRRR